jgi:hypothetical protein
MTDLLKSAGPVAPPIASLTTLVKPPCFGRSFPLREATNTACAVFPKRARSSA